jgi:hypothetical protein
VAIGAPNTGTATTFAAAGTSAVPFPATTHAGAVLTLGVSLFSTNPSCTTPAGWTLAAFQDGTASGLNTAGTTIDSIYVFYKVADGTEGGTNLTVTHTSTGNECQIVEWPGVDQINPLDVSVVGTDDTTAGTNLVLNTITPVTAGCTLVYWSSDNTAAHTATQPGGWTEIADGSGATANMESAYIQNQAAGSAIGGTVVWSGSGKQVAILAALRPAPDLAVRPAQIPRVFQAIAQYAQRLAFGPPTTALLENQLLGGADTARHQHAAEYIDRREVPQQRIQFGLPSTPFLLENELLGSADDLSRHRAWYTDRRVVPQQRAYVSDPLLLTTAQLEVLPVPRRQELPTLPNRVPWLQRLLESVPAAAGGGGQVVFDAIGPSSSGQTANGTNSISWSHTVASGGVLLVGVALGIGNDAGNTMAATFNGVSGTSLGIFHSGATTAGYVQVWGWLTPTTGSAQTVSVTATAGAGGTALSLTGGSISFTGAGSFGTVTTANTPTNTTTATATTSGSASTSLLAGFIGDGSGTTSATSPSTSRIIDNDLLSSACGNFALATSPGTGSAVTMAWTISADDFAEIIVEVVASAGGPAAIPPSVQQRIQLPLQPIPQQRRYISDPLLLTTAELENELLGSADTSRHYTWFSDRRVVPQQRSYFDISLLFTAQLENELLGGADTLRHYTWFTDRRVVPQQRLYISDPLLLTTAELENELLGGAQDQHRTWYTDRRVVPYQIRYLMDESQAVGTNFDPTQGGLPLWITEGVYAYTVNRRLVPQQRVYYDTSLLSTAELENELLGGAGTPRYYNVAATNASRWWMPQQPSRLADPLLITTAELENELLGGGDLLRRYMIASYWDRRLVPQQRLYVSDPLLLTTALLEITPNSTMNVLSAATHQRLPWLRTRIVQMDQSSLPTGPFDPTVGGIAPRYLIYAVDRRETVAQRLYISDPSFYPTTAPTDPLTLAYGAGGTYWHLYNMAADFVDRRMVPQQRRYISDPNLLLTAELENELLGGASTWMHYTWFTDRRLVPQQRVYFDLSLLATAQLENELLGGADTIRHLMWFTDRRLVPQQRLYISDPLLLTTAQLDSPILGSADVLRHYTWYVDRRLVPQQRNYVSDPNLLLTAELENELLGGGDTGRYNFAPYWDRRLVPQQRSTFLVQPPVPFDVTLAAYDDLRRRYMRAATHVDRRMVPQQRSYVSDPSTYISGRALTFLFGPLRAKWIMEDLMRKWLEGPLYTRDIIYPPEEM